MSDDEIEQIKGIMVEVNETAASRAPWLRLVRPPTEQEYQQVALVCAANPTHEELIEAEVTKVLTLPINQDPGFEPQPPQSA